MSKNNYVLWLDDFREPPDKSYFVAKSYDEATGIVTMLGAPKEMHLDHDLGSNSKTGMDFVKWLVEQDLNGKIDLTNTEVYSQSDNPAGKDNILNTVKRYKKFRSGKF